MNSAAMPSPDPAAGRASVVVPTRNSGRTLAACLDSLRAQTHGDVELIVVDNGSTDDTLAIAGARADRVETWGPERSAQRNRGAAISTGGVVVFVDSDMVLEPGVVAEAVAAFAADRTLGGLVLPELARGQGFLARCRALEKRLYLGDASVEAARAFRREVLAEVGGYDEALTAGEDWDLPDRVAAAGYRIGRVRSFVWHDEGRVDLRRTFAKKRYYGRWLPRYRQKHGCAARPLLRRRSLARLGLVARSPLLAVGLVVLKAVEVAGLALGALEGRRAGCP